jgi:hypothetical protein
MFEYASLEDLAELLRDQGIWNYNDFSIVKRLTRLRNGVVHKNRLTVSNLLYSGKEISPFDIPNLTKRIDTQSVILASLELILKIMEGSMRIAPPRLQHQYARLTTPTRPRVPR